MASLPDDLIAGAASPGRAREIVLRHGWNAVAYQILNPGFTLWFSAEGDAVAGYVKRSRRWIIAGAPTCSRERLPQVIAQLEAAARNDGCRVCYFGAAVRLYDDCKNPPLHSVVALGSQPVWDPARWHQMIIERPSVRAQLHRATNKGVTVAECPAPTPSDVHQMQHLLDTWVRYRTMPPMHFLVEPETLHLLTDRRVFLARRHGELCAFLVASPIPCRRGWLIEQIIRHPAAPNGTNELLLHHAMLTFANEKAGYVTLGLVPLSRHLPAHGPKNPLWLALLFAWARAHGRRFYNFEGLEAFKAKFHPTGWEPIYAIATEPRFSPKTLWAIAAAFSHKQSPLLHGITALGMSIKEELRRFAPRVRQTKMPTRVINHGRHSQ